jgi:hypothetical protein
VETEAVLLKGALQSKLLLAGALSAPGGFLRFAMASYLGTLHTGIYGAHAQGCQFQLQNPGGQWLHPP